VLTAIAAPTLDHGGPVGLRFENFPAGALLATLPERFAVIVARYPERLAIADGDVRLTYAALAVLAGGISASLPPRGWSRGMPIGILLEQEARALASMLGVLAAGHIVVPLDAGHPQERIAAIAAHAGLGAVICSARLRDRAVSLAPAGAPIICLEDVTGTQEFIAYPGGSPDDLAIILYTSGSTGPPKGVMQNHRGLLHDVMQYANAIHIRPDDRLTLLYSPATAGAVRDIWGALLMGASLHVFQPREGMDALAAFLHRIGPSIYHSVPVLLRHLSAHLAASAGRLAFPSIRLGYIAGDRLDVKDVRAFFGVFPQALLYTGFGSTEASTIFRHRFIRPSTTLEGEIVAVGRAMPERHTLLLDEMGRPAPPGDIGEIVVCSPFIARGYWRAPALTAERFMPDPQHVGWRHFRTGDMGRLCPEDGMLQHLGRADHMVKLGGRRIELPAVEAALKALPGVQEAAALIRPPADGAAEPVLVAHWQAAAGEPPTEGALLARLRHVLPPVMVPAELVRVPALPLLPNFKVDRKALASIDAGLAAFVPAAATPAHGTACLVAEEAARLLKLPAGLASDRNLAAMGMDSIGLVDFALALENRLGRAVPLEVILAARSADRIGAWLDATSASAKPGSAGLVTLRHGRNPDLPPLLWLHGLSGDVYDRVSALLPLMPPDRDWLGLRDPALRQLHCAAESVEDHATLLLASLRAAGLSVSRGAIPIGWSYGGRLAWELASRMEDAGWRVPQVVVIDAPPWPTGIRPAFATASTDMEAMRAHHYRLAASYTARAAPLNLVLIRARQHLASRAEDLGWGALARRVTVGWVPGRHDVFTAGRLHHLAAALCEGLDCPQPLAGVAAPFMAADGASMAAPGA
jgi:amino acid adenylation domain-containing protein